MKKSKALKHIQKVSIMCVAIADGYFGGRVIKTDVNFRYDHVLINGKFPLWCRPLNDKLEIDEKYESEFSKLSSEEKAKYLVKSPSKKESSDDNSEAMDKMSARLEELEAQLAVAESDRDHFESKLEAIEDIAEDTIVQESPSIFPDQGEAQETNINNLV